MIGSDATSGWRRDSRRRGHAAVLAGVAAACLGACVQTPAAPALPEKVTAEPRIDNIDEMLAAASEPVKAAYMRYARVEPVVPVMADGPDADLASDIADLLRHAREADTDWTRELFIRVAKDQFWRGGLGADVSERLGLSDAADAAAFRSLVVLRLQEIDASNTAFLKADVDRRGGWPGKSAIGAGAAHFAWLLVQHADRDPEFQERALALMEPMVPQGEVEAKDFAYLFDRVAVAAGRPQRYGSQGRCVPGEGRWAPRPMEEPELIDQRRASVGLGPMADYIAIFQGGQLCGGQ